MLARIFDLIPFEAGDTIIEQGEKASWAGMLLEGEFDAYVAGVGKVGSVPPGDFVGEMTVFEGGKRNATCKASKPGVIGAVLLSKLDDLYLDYPSLHVKLLQAFATSSLTKVRRMLDSARAKKKAKEEAKEEAKKAGEKRKSRKSKRGKRAGRHQGRNSVVQKAEILYRMKIARFASAAKKVTKQLNKARKSEHAAKHSSNNEKLVRRKLQRQINTLREEVARYQDREEEYQKMKALLVEKGLVPGKKKKKRRRSQFRNQSIGEIGALAAAAAAGSASVKLNEAMARLATAEAAQKKLSAQLEGERKAKLELATQLRKHSLESTTDSDRSEAKKDGQAAGDVRKMQSVIDKLRRKHHENEQKWVQRHSSTQDLLAQAQSEHAELKDSHNRWRATAVKASAQEIERLKAVVADQNADLEEKTEALEDAEASADMLKAKLEQYKDVVELQRASAASAENAAQLALERAERYKDHAEKRTRGYHRTMARLVRLLAWGVVQHHLRKRVLGRSEARAAALAAELARERAATEGRVDAVQAAADRRVRRCMVTATQKMHAKGRRLGEEKAKLVGECRAHSARARDLDLALAAERERSARLEAELKQQAETFGTASRHFHEQMDRQKRFLRNMKTDNEEREDDVRRQESALRRSQTENNAMVRDLEKCQAHLNMSEQRRVALERAVLVASGDRGDRRWWPGAAWLPPIDPASPIRAQRVARTLDARGNSIIFS